MIRRTAARSAKIAVGAMMLASGSPVSAAADARADFVAKLFIDACVPNMGQPAKVRTWAEEHHLNQISSLAALGVFVGPGDRGAAWAVPAASGNYALSIRGTTTACAVWAQAADPEAVEALFKTLIQGVERPGLKIAVDEDLTSPSPSGKVRTLIYNVTVPEAAISYEFTMQTAEHPGGAFQASIQVARASGHP